MDYDWDIMDKFSVINHIRQYQLYGLEGPDCVLYFSKKTRKQIMPFETDIQVQAIIPDVIVWSHEKNPIVFEIDGFSHGPDGNSISTEERNIYYKINHIPAIIINKEQLKQSKVAWKEYIDSELRRQRIIN